MSGPTYYEVLEISENASQDRIKNAFRTRAKQCHPDQAEGMAQQEAKRRFIRVREAFDVLGDPESRKAYDEGRKHGTSSEDKYEEEWKDFNEAPNQTIGDIVELAAEAGREFVEEGVSLIWRAVSYAFTYGFLLAVPASFIIQLGVPADAPEGVQNIMTVLSIGLGIVWGLLLGALWGVGVYAYKNA